MKYFLCLAIETNNFVFEVKVIMGLKTAIAEWFWKLGHTAKQTENVGYRGGAPFKVKTLTHCFFCGLIRHLKTDDRHIISSLIIVNEAFYPKLFHVFSTVSCIFD